MNILSNAYKNTREGNITLRIDHEDNRNGKSLLRVTVSDTGRGLRQINQAHLFVPFVQVHDSSERREGHGLGLTITEKIVQQFGGELGFQPNESGIGTQFFFTFEYEDQLQMRHENYSTLNAIEHAEVTVDVSQISEEEEKQILDPKVFDLEQKRKESRFTFDEYYLQDEEVKECTHADILIVDDARVVLECLLLFVQGFSTATADTASSGEQAITKGRERLQSKCCRPYKLILMDIHLGDMNGYEATTQLRNIFQEEETKVIAVTALQEKFVKDKLQPAGMNGVLYKPLTKTKILNLFKEFHIFNGKER